ncbi:hypothetical protein [Luteococcus peritonei]|uniref:Polysaccharide chain length determinant N-terminal domain-containing protein n=1 Tax=Luteococcus peritonei TaxID=88874 RepID=A0ABW4RUF1_9ACTN
MELTDYLSLGRRSWRLLLTLALLGALLGLLAGRAQQPRYLATAEVVVAVAGADSVDELNAASNYLDSIAQTYAAVGGSQLVLQPAAGAVGLDYDQAVAMTTVERREATSVIETTVQAGTAAQAAGLANAVAAEQTRRLPELIKLPSGARGGVEVTQITRAAEPKRPAGPSPLLFAAGGLGGGLVLGLALALLRARAPRPAPLRMERALAS